MNIRGGFSQGKKVVGRDDGAKGQSGAPAAAFRISDLVLTGRIADGDADHEAVDLRLGSSCVPEEPKGFCVAMTMKGCGTA